MKKQTTIGLIFTLAVLAFVKLTFHGYAIYDDAYMFIRYAHNWLEHNTYGWNPGVRTYGCTSVGYVCSNAMLMSVGLRDWLSQETFLLIHAYTYFLGALWLFYRLIPLIITRHAQYLPYIVVGVMLCLFGNGKIWMTITGMDTMMSLFFNTLLVYTAFRYIQKPHPNRLVFLGIASYLVFWVRPDNALYASLFPALFLWINGASRRDLFLCGGIITACFLGDLTAKYLYFGHVLPIPFVVKSSGFFEAYVGIYIWNTWYFVADLLFWSGPFVLVSMITFQRQHIRQILPYLVPVCLTWMVLMGKVQIMGYHSRLFVPSVPYIVAMALSLLNLAPLDSLLEKTVWRREILQKSIMGLLIFGGLYGIGYFVFGQKQTKAETEAKTYRLTYTYVDSLPAHGPIAPFDILMDIMDSLGSSLTIAGSEHGALGSYNLDNRVLCLAGLHNPEALEAGSFNQQAIDASLDAEKPDLIWMPHDHYVAFNHRILTSEKFRAEYDFFDGCLYFGMALRKDSPFYDEMLAFVARRYGRKTLHPTIF